jgi:protein-histidine pros-kinase
MFGCHRSEVIGRKVETLMPERMREAHVKHRELYNRSDIGAHTRTMGLGQQLMGLRGDGNEFPADITLSRMVAPRGVINLALIRYSPKFIEHVAMDTPQEKSAPAFKSRDSGESDGGK